MPKKSLVLNTDEQVMDFIKTVHDKVLERHTKEKANVLQEALKESRDAILSKAETPAARHFARPLPCSGEATTVSNLLVCRPCTSTSEESSSNTSTEGASNNASEEAAAAAAAATQAAQEPNTVDVATTMSRDEGHILSRPVSVVFQNPRGQRWTTTRSPVPLEGAHEPRPTGATPAFLKTHFATDDERALSYVPYFGDDDHEDLYSELYNTESRERMMEFGPEYRERETLKRIDDTLELAQEKLRGSKSVSKERLETALASLLKLDANLLSNRHSQEPEPDASPKKTAHESDYLGVVDSFRQCFCRRCFTYDCNMHGCQKKPDLTIQGELAIEKERSGFWKKAEEAEATTSTAAESSNEPADGASTAGNGSKKRPLAEALAQLDERHASMKELTAAQKVICERTFVMHQGDCDKIAVTLGAPRKLVADYVASEGMNLDIYKHIRPDTELEAKKRKAYGKKSMKGYNASWLKRVEDAEIHPFFVPCDHKGPCSEENCSCVKNRFFCTKHCVWGEKSRNYFRGCSCKGGKCCTKSCACYAAKRECDPDLCVACGACTDPAGKPASNQRCRNDNIGMRRHGQLLLAKSGIEDAGWGLFTKHALKKGEFVHEYVGEVISQEEAERRGMIYDKMNRSYLFNLSSDLVVDASRKGNKTRFANHSDKPNCEIKMTWVNGDIHIGLFACCDIEPQTELFFDYRYDVGMDNELIVKPAVSVDWMQDSKMANKVSARKDG